MIRHVLLDADGVLQNHPVGVAEALRRLLGKRSEQFLLDLADAERPLLQGDGDGGVPLAALLRRYGVQVPVDRVHRLLWRDVEVDQRVVDLVTDLRRSGLGVHLATNQNPDRAAYMRTELGYGELFDTSWYSCEVGAAKPDPAYYRAVLAGIGSRPEETLYVDDAPPNVRAAADLGIVALGWTTSDDITALRQAMASHGVDWGSSPT